MISIGKFFERIQNARSKEFVAISAVQKSIEKNTSFQVPATSISFKAAGVILKNISQSLKSAIYIKKEQIIRDINSEQTLRLIDDIR